MRFLISSDHLLPLKLMSPSRASLASELSLIASVPLA
jgi:hypothetical protein